MEWWSENRPTTTTWKIISSKLKMKCHKLELNMYNDYHNLERELVNSWFEVLQMHLGSTFSLLYSLGPKHEQGKKMPWNATDSHGIFFLLVSFPSGDYFNWSLFCFYTGNFLKKSRFPRRLTVMSFVNDTISKIGDLPSTSQHDHCDHNIVGRWCYPNHHAPSFRFV